jgi:hypothetical protein
LQQTRDADDRLPVPKGRRCRRNWFQEMPESRVAVPGTAEFSMSSGGHRLTRAVTFTLPVAVTLERTDALSRGSPLRSCCDFIEDETAFEAVRIFRHRPWQRR